MRSGIFPVLRKEFLVTLRDRRTLLIVIFFPVMMLVIYGYGVTFDVKYLPTTVLDQDRSGSSREFLGRFFNSGHFRLRDYVDDYRQIEAAFRGGEANLALVLPPDFERQVKRGENPKVQILVDGSDANTATLSLGYTLNIAQNYYSSLLAGSSDSASKSPRLSPRIRVWYNPELRSANFIVPGIIAIIMMMMGAIFTSIAIVGEKETGTIEQIMASPIKPLEYIIGKLIPYVCLSALDVLLVVAVGYYLFRVPIKGSFPLLAIFSILFLGSALGLGLLVSSLSETVRAASLGAVFSSLLPSVLLSGFVFPIENMPPALQALTYLVPARYFLEILRGIYLKGVGLQVLWSQGLFLLLFGSILILFSASRFKKRLD